MSTVAAPSNELAGTGALVRAALRADRWRTVVWAVAVAGLTQVSVASLAELYVTPESRAGRAQLISSPAATALAGPGYGLDDYTVGAMTANELGLWVMLPVAIMALLTVTRHLRAAEESGRLELVRSGPVGRDAPVVAGLVAATVATLVVGGLTFVALLAAGLDVVGSLALAGGIVMVGLVFAGVCAVTCQLTAHARTASSLAMAVLGVAFLLRAVGDVRGPEGTSALTWLSPFGWAQATRAYVDERFWPLAIGVVVAGALVVLAFWLVGRRDLGTGLLAERLGRPRASARLTGMVALTVRRQLGAILSWGLGIVVMGAFIGLLAGELVDFIAEETQVVELFPTGPNGAAASAFALYMVVLAVATGAYVASSVGAARAEETAARGAIVLSGPVSRVRWLGSQVAVGAAAAVVILVLTGLVMGLTAATSMGDAYVGKLVGAAAVTLPAVGVVLGVAVVVMGAAPRAFGLVWAYVAYVGVVGLFAELLPDGSDVLSPFAYTPRLPAEAMDWPPVLGLTAVAVALLALGLGAFRRRDVVG
ncbi:ABC transporter permease [Cellulomonas fengjieae]|uniref:Anibiotic ABC transporter n=1 Tax=Cellulomonas fengjieae TaxID=2819978 RepID=A0ABS3SIH3_9CELL|nr:anibiotic ABC transporter [Cellulomonas fengjieae]MBO3085114.1 anibiotic ABC transporter [Cellulomonas fengjieae]QVI66306.1 anibiotic ABC transporter [Cellulomonas fengjieae]